MLLHVKEEKGIILHKGEEAASFIEYVICIKPFANRSCHLVRFPEALTFKEGYKLATE